MKRLDSDFTVTGTQCTGWLYQPDRVMRPPVVIMAHGLGAERTSRLPAYAEKFAERGLASFVFDYRNFGDSAGYPRNLINPWRHIHEWIGAIEHVSSLDAIDAYRIAAGRALRCVHELSAVYISGVEEILNIARGHSDAQSQIIPGWWTVILDRVHGN